MIRHLTALSFLTLTACGPAHPTLTVDGQPLDREEARASLTTSATGSVLFLTVSDPGPPNTADAGVGYTFRVELAPGVVAGASLDVAGDASLDSETIGGEVASRSFAASAGHDARVLGVYLQRVCFCTSVVTHFDQIVRGHLDVVDVSAAGIVVEVDLEVDGLPVGATQTQRVHVAGRFTATP